MHPKITTYSSMMSDNFRLREETRIGIETEAAALAAMRRTNSHLKAMKLVMQAFTEKIRTGRCAVDLGFQFHLGIAKIAGNRYFSNILTPLGPKLIPSRKKSSWQ